MSADIAPHRNCGDGNHLLRLGTSDCFACDHTIYDGVAIPWELPSCPIDCQENFMRCPFFDFPTKERCSQVDGHPPFHTLPDGTAFGVGYTLEDANEWSH